MAFSNGATKSLTSQLRLRGGVEVRVLAGNISLTDTDANFQNIDPGGSGRTITLPAEDLSNGLVFGIYNAADAAESLTINDDAGSTIATLGRGDSAILGCTGTAWTLVQSTVGAQSVDTAQIADSAVTTAKIADGAVTVAKLSTTFAGLPVVADPGTGQAIPVTGNADVSLTLANAGETNTVADPTFRGQTLRLYVGTFTASATRAVTFASAFNAAGNTVATFNALGDFAEFVAIGATPKWKIRANDSVALS